MIRKLSPEDEKRKKTIFDGMSPRRQKHILKKGYDDWDPFIEPKDPVDLRVDKSRRTARDLAREFLATCEAERYSNAFGQGVWDICLGLVNDDDRYKGMYEFSCWYRDLLKKEGLK
ncbi:MAG: hypothetical protein JRI58_11395 [Deltaproteobacteria bacterium]|nr:hypothetical protein [Deltaproteobacteria bacterium]MBW2075328.1 hypothetical protein [Deltaproteobacteria bacterium]RLB80421.1 MAG: hypothetical protein DRH17_11980 [Deltaproteobacteria bacterium]